MNLAFHIELALRIILGTLLASVIGWERDAHGRAAGLKTHVIVGLASATFMVVSTQLWDLQHYHPGQNVTLDPSRIAAAVVTGVGFLGGGAILRTGLGVQGLTTAAGLWLVAAIGLCSGGGFYPEAVFVTLMGLFSLTILRRFEKESPIQRHLVVHFSGKLPKAAEVKDKLAPHVLTYSEVAYRKVEDNGTTLIFEIQCPTGVNMKALVEDVESLPGAKVVSVGSPGVEAPHS